MVSGIENPQFRAARSCSILFSARRASQIPLTHGIPIPSNVESQARHCARSTMRSSISGICNNPDRQLSNCLHQTTPLRRSSSWSIQLGPDGGLSALSRTTSWLRATLRMTSSAAKSRVFVNTNTVGCLVTNPSNPRLSQYRTSSSLAMSKHANFPPTRRRHKRNLSDGPPHTEVLELVRGWAILPILGEDSLDDRISALNAS
jgi:hypothetical protein